MRSWLNFILFLNKRNSYHDSYQSISTDRETLYYDESTSQLIFKGGPYYLIGWTKMK